jgi:hypothetical protein
MQATFEAHPTSPNLALKKFHCAECGPIKIEIISLKPPDKLPPGLAA